MRIIIKLIIMMILGMLIYFVTIVPKLMSWAWYGKWNLEPSRHKFHEAIGEVIFSIIEDEDIKQ